MTLAYPHRPGFREPATSKAAADKIAPRDRNLCQRVLEAVRRADMLGLTPDEAAEQLNETVLNIRPRFSQLKQRGEIEDTGMRRKSISGNNQAVFRAVIGGADNSGWGEG